MLGSLFCITLNVTRCWYCESCIGLETQWRTSDSGFLWGVCSLSKMVAFKTMVSVDTVLSFSISLVSSLPFPSYHFPSLPSSLFPLPQNLYSKIAELAKGNRQKMQPQCACLLFQCHAFLNVTKCLLPKNLPLRDHGLVFYCCYYKLLQS